MLKRIRKSVAFAVNKSIPASAVGYRQLKKAQKFPFVLFHKIFFALYIKYYALQ